MNIPAFIAAMRDARNRLTDLNTRAASFEQRCTQINSKAITGAQLAEKPPACDLAQDFDILNDEIHSVITSIQDHMDHMERFIIDETGVSAGPTWTESGY